MIQIAQLSPGALGRGAEKKYINLFFCLCMFVLLERAVFTIVCALMLRIYLCLFCALLVLFFSDQ